jgi:hypothetical protein
VPTPRQQLDSFLAKYTPDLARQAKASLRKLRALTPGATELVYDNYNALVVGFCPGDRPSEAILSLAFFPEHVSLCFLQGAKSKLPDPEKRLRGSGTTARHIRLASPADLDDPYVLTLIDAALAKAKVRLDAGAKRRLVIQSVSAKQRPRRPKP